MKYNVVSSIDDRNESSIDTSNKVKDVIMQEEDKEIVKSKVILIECIKISVSKTIEGDFTFKVNTKFANLPNGEPIEDIDITSKEDIDWLDPELNLRKLNSIIRHCGILDKYRDYFVKDPEIIINRYDIECTKQNEYFEEFLNDLDTIECMYQ